MRIWRVGILRVDALSVGASLTLPLFDLDVVKTFLELRCLSSRMSVVSLLLSTDTSLISFLREAFLVD